MHFPTNLHRSLFIDPSSTNYDVQWTSGAANTKGAYVQAIAAMPRDCVGLRLASYSAGFSAVNWHARCLSDIAVGDSGSEVIVVNNLYHEVTDYLRRQSGHLIVPIRIAAGQRVAFRGQSPYGNTYTGAWSVSPIYGDLAGSFYACSTFGANTGSTSGADVDPGAVADTWGAWLEYTSAIDKPVRAVSVGIPTRANGASATNWSSFQVGYGAAGDEQPVVRSFTGNSSSVSQGVVGPTGQIMPCNIPAGSRIAMRTRSQINDATDRLLQYILYCWH